MSAVSSVGGGQDSIYKYDRTINTGYNPNCRSLSNADKKKILSESKKQGMKLGDGKVNKTGNEIDKLKKLKNNNSKFKNKIN